MPEIYIRIEELCRKKGITVTDLCRECSIPRATLSDFKTGRIKSLSAMAVSKIAGFFSVSTDYLLGNKQDDGLDALKVALFGGETEVTDEMWEEVKRYAKYIGSAGKKEK